MIQAVIFDCFGVLIGDALKMQGAKLRAAGKEAAANQLHDVMRMADLQLLSADDAAQREAEAIGVSIDELQQIVASGEVVDHALIDYIRSLKPQYKLGMVSNIRNRAYIDAHFEPGLLDELFEVVVTSGEAGHLKPDPEIYQMALDKLGVTGPATVMTDDVQAYAEGAAAVGIHPIWYKDLIQFKQAFQAVVEQNE